MLACVIGTSQLGADAEEKTTSRQGGGEGGSRGEENGRGAGKGEAAAHAGAHTGDKEEEEAQSRREKWRLGPKQVSAPGTLRQQGTCNGVMLLNR